MYSSYVSAFSSAATASRRSRAATAAARPAWSTTPEAISASALRAPWNQCGRMYLFSHTARCTSAKSTRLTPTSTSSAPTSTRLRKCAAAFGKLGGNIARTKRDATTYARRRNTKCPIWVQSLNASAAVKTPNTHPSEL